ncbi:uracil DNA glycosylase superfamily protein [Pseudoduganella flava]|nr:uracil-DNA glycosylase family protein [Pseudoduganella flava]TWI44868.1 uracil DNA glycosylase superfamily protein [Pseudoduganella flava]
MTDVVTRADLTSYLFNKQANISAWPPELEPVAEMVRGTAFFPGGSGFWEPEQEQGLPDVMVVGQDFSTKSEHQAMLAGLASDVDSATWRNFLKLAKAASLDLQSCFFTNAIMGLRKGGSCTGPNPGYVRRNKDFVAATHDFLLEQVQVVRPRLIVILGLPAARVFAAIAADLASWRTLKFRELDARELSIRKAIRIGDVTTTCVVLLHPSYRQANLRYRRLDTPTCSDPEISLLKNAIAEALPTEETTGVQR